MLPKPLPCGTRIRVSHPGGWDGAKIGRWNRRINGPREKVPGYELVRFDDGSSLLVHRSHITVDGEAPNAP